MIKKDFGRSSVIFIKNGKQWRSFYIFRDVISRTGDLGHLIFPALVNALSEEPLFFYQFSNIASIKILSRRGDWL